MAETFVQLPSDASNTGKKVRAQSRTVGADTVHEHYMIVQDITTDTQARVIAVAPTTEAGLVVRNIPSGTQPVSDGGGSLTVDGTFFQATQPVSAVSLPLPTGASTEATLASLLTSSQLIDDTVQVLGTDVFTEGVNKGITLGAVRRDADTTLVGLTNEFTPLQTDARGLLKVEVFTGETLPVSLASTTITGTVAVTDNAGSLTVDAPVGTPVFVRLSDGTAAIATLPVSAASLPLPTGAATLAEQQTQTASLSVLDDWDNTASDGASVSGDVAHDGIDAGEPVKIGMKAVSHGANPTAVAANDRTNWYSNIAGIPFILGGHPNIVSAEYNTTAAQTDDNILPLIAAGTIYVITGISVMASNANTVNTSVRIGFGAATLPASGVSGADAVTKIVLSHPFLAAGSGIVKGGNGGIVGIGGDGEELRITCSVPTTGSLFVQVDYFTITS